MKKLLFTLCFLSAGIFAQAQIGFTVEHLLLEMPNPSSTEIEQILKTKVKNTSNAPMVLRWVRETICSDPAYGNSVCIGVNCFEQTTNSKTFDLDAGAETELSVHLWKNATGTPKAEVTVEIYPENAPGNTVTSLFKFSQCAVGTQDLTDFPQIEVYPNPVVDVLNLRNTADASKVMLYDLTGALLLTHDLQSGSQIQMANFAKGTYFLRILNETGSKSALLHVQKI